MNTEHHDTGGIDLIKSAGPSTSPKGQPPGVSELRGAFTESHHSLTGEVRKESRTALLHGDMGLGLRETSASSESGNARGKLHHSGVRLESARQRITAKQSHLAGQQAANRGPNESPTPDSAVIHGKPPQC